MIPGTRLRRHRAGVVQEIDPGQEQVRIGGGVSHGFLSIVWVNFDQHHLE